MKIFSLQSWNLNGFTETIKSVFPRSTTHICVVHQIHNSCKCVVWKDMEESTADMKDIYTSVNRLHGDTSSRSGARSIAMQCRAGTTTGTI
ncbi:hypothetical protein DWW18_17645 [Butyricimonas virosa]|uniref:Mutator family transposase n=1 Tax=Butyricimonas virosa TaxID=544645 RepID=A0A412WVI3_9BACT|nr:transposase [Butyricimonas virosa]RGV31348.1 hypothetical protein DWW18_17645 [Butyricimonas virosa]